MWSLQGQAQSPNPKEHPTLFLAQNDPCNLTAKILSMVNFIRSKKTDGLSTIVWVSIPVRPKLHSRIRHLCKNSKHFKLRHPLDFGHSVKSREAKLLVSCNLIDGNWPLAIVWSAPWYRRLGIYQSNVSVQLRRANRWGPHTFIDNSCSGPGRMYFGTISENQTWCTLPLSFFKAVKHEQWSGRAGC